MGFTFKQFHIEQDECAMKVGTDGVLLGSWATGGKYILDIGTGTGLIALMLAQRFSSSHIDAIEIDTRAVMQAKRNVESSPFAEQITVKHCSLQNYSEKQGLYDAIVCNPPYFENSMKNRNENKTIARHTDTLPFNVLIKSAYKLLSSYKPPKQVIIELGKIPSEYYSTTECLQDCNGKKSEWYRELTDEFYLK